MVPIKKFLSLNSLKLIKGALLSSSRIMKNTNAQTENPASHDIQAQSNQLYCCPLSKTTCIERSHNTREIIPRKSVFLTFFLV